MSIKLNGATSGSVELDVPAAVTGGDVNLVIPGAGTLDRLERAGNVLQVVESNTDTEVEVASTTYTDSGLSASITPSNASSKILVMVDQFLLVDRAASNYFAGIRLQRGNTTIMTPVADATGPFNLGLHVTGATVVQQWQSWSNMFLDSPNTTNSVTYKTQGRMYQSSSSGRMVFQQNSTQGDGSSRMILIEVAA
jgi:hypothetical protein|tara:strand:- start:85 stop:669 length:585 start_codon:yes stop_codon:yes gene_type:complete